MTLDPQIKDTLAELQQKSFERSMSRPLTLESWPDSKRGTPNSFLRSALFVSGRGKDNKDRPYFDNEILASQQGVTVRFTGKQLNQDDLTLWETIVHLAKEQPLGVICEFTAYEILKSLQINTGKAEYEWLEKGIDRLTACLVKINFDGKNYGRPLIIGYEKIEARSHYRLELSRDMIKLYGQSDWTAIDWRQRITLRKKPLAQFLHGYYSSHKSPHPVKIETLHKLSGSGIKNLATFKQKLKNALDDLIKIGFLDDYGFIGNLVWVKRN